MVGSKVVLFGVLSFLGFLNFRLVHNTNSNGRPQPFLTQLRRFGEVEIGLGFSVILAAASLTSLPPATDIASSRVTSNEIIARIKPRIPRLRSPQPEELLQQSYEASGTAPLASNYAKQAVSRGAADIAWSEYNHHWAGLLVLAIGIFAALAARDNMRWAKYWPLLFLALAAFIVLRADPENWPLGSGSFWASFASPEVLLHRVFAGLIIAFAISETRIQTHSTGFTNIGLAFPIICALAGVLLLTHSHNLANIKEEMLAELSHNLLAILGILAGWSRWLELRLPAQERIRKPLALLWPVCFVLIGLVLLNYREG
jgi:putative copper resistance protein D